MTDPAPSLRSVPPPVYLDNHATTPVDDRVAAVVIAAMQRDFGNANSSGHAMGLTASELVEASKAHVAALVGGEAEDVHFTSSSTEAIHLAMSHAIGLKRQGPLRIAIARTEHMAVIDAALSAKRQELATITWIDVDGVGRIDRQSLHAALAGEVDLVCLMAANNEVGTIHPVAEFADLARAVGSALLVDATQAAGRIPLNAMDDGIDYLVFNAHKMNGPKGVGALLSPIYNPDAVYGLAGAHQPTPNVPGIVGFAEACRLLLQEGAVENERLRLLRDRLQIGLLNAVPDIVVNGDTSARLPNNLHVSALGAPNDVVLSRLSATVAISSGSACTSGAQSPSHVLVAMGLTQSAIESGVRMSPGRYSTESDIDFAIAAIAEAVSDVRAMLGNEYA